MLSEARATEMGREEEAESGNIYLEAMFQEAGAERWPLWGGWKVYAVILERWSVSHNTVGRVVYRMRF